MKKLAFQFFIFIFGFFALWLLLGRVDWVDLFHIAKLSEENQKKVGEFVFNTYNIDKKQVENDSVKKLVANLKNKICIAGNIDTATIDTYVFVDKEINAFALPGGNIVVNTALIEYCDNPDMLAGVLAHEIGHIEKDHVSKKLIRNIGLSSLLMLAGGSQNAEIIKRILHTLTSTNFDRMDESEADEMAVYYMQRTSIDPSALASFFDKMGRKQTVPAEVLNWVSTHPAAEVRAAKIRKLAKQGQSYTPAIDAASWAYLQEAVTRP